MKAPGMQVRYMTIHDHAPTKYTQRYKTSECIKTTDTVQIRNIEDPIKKVENMQNTNLGGKRTHFGGKTGPNPTWQEATSEPLRLDVTDPTLTLLGLRPTPADGSPTAKPRPGMKPESRRGASSTQSPCSSYTRPARGPTWRTMTRKARTSPARLSPSTFSGPYARGMRSGFAMSMPRPRTPPVLSPGLARGRAHGTPFTNTGSPRHRHRLHGQGRTPPPPPNPQVTLPSPLCPHSPPPSL